MKVSRSVLAALAIAPVTAEIYFKEDFNDAGWKDRWTVPSDWKPKAELGEWKHTAGEWYGNKDDLGVQTSQDARFYGMSAPLSKPFVSGDKPLVIQYSVKNEQKLDCGGAYIKLLPGGDSFDAKGFGGDTPYAIMFGPDICGSGNKKTHVILNFEKKNDNVLIKKDVPVETDDVSHLYTLVIYPDNTVEVFTDDKSVRKGDIGDEFEVLEPKQIKEPGATKPEDWDDRKKIPDPEDVKPEGYDDIPKEIADPEASKPEDWDDEDDGEWEAPMIDNPDYKGPWKPNMISNPDYQGKWEHPMIDNPDFVDDPELYKVCKAGCTHVGFEIWQVTTGTVFDDIIVTDSLEEAQAYAKETFFAKKDKEKSMYDDIKKKKREEDAAQAAEDDDEDYSDDDFDLDGFGDEF